MDESESKRVNVNACYTDKSESKGVHEMYISVNTSKVKYSKYEEYLVTDLL